MLPRILPVLLCGVSSLADGTLQDIPTTHRVTLKEDWKPTPEQTQRALRQIQSYLGHPRKGYRSDPEAMQAIREIFSHPSEYYVQFIGRYSKGRKAIFCNFVSLDNPDEIAAFRKKWFWASDGGSDFWHIWYEPEKDECSGFTPNPCCPRIRKTPHSANKSLEPTPNSERFREQERSGASTLAVAMRTFNFTKQFREFAMLVPASGGSALSR